MIRITRGSAYINSARAYKIIINDIECGKIKINETKEFKVKNGSHTVRAKIDWCRSNEVHVEVNDSVVELEVGTSVTGWRILFVRLYITFLRNKYLFLREKETVHAPSEDAK